MRCLAETTVAPVFLSSKPAAVSPSSLTQVDRELWSRFSTHSELFVEDQVPGFPDGFWNTTVLIDQSADSQFDALVNAAREGKPLPEALACLAMSGSKFHGNRERAWRALPGNLHFSSFVQKTLDAAECGPALSMLPTVAVTDALAVLMNRHSPAAGQADWPTPWIKWVNDVYLNNSKVSGSLVSSQVNGREITTFVLGIGLNVGVAPALGDAGVLVRATSLSEHGIVVPLPEVFRELLSALAIRIAQMTNPAGRDAIYQAYRSRLGGIGRVIELFPEGSADINNDPPMVRGRLIDVHPDLSIEIEGSSQRYRSGRLRFAAA